jgi:hypothetical protein
VAQLYDPPFGGLCHAPPCSNSLGAVSWTEEKEKAFAALKLLLMRAPVVQPLDWNREFHVFVDASDIAIGSVLMQKYGKNWFRPVYYASPRLSKAERNYWTTEREALGMIYSVTKFRHYLLANGLRSTSIIRRWYIWCPKPR